MKYQIDQSGKIEQTAHNTVLACSNEETYSIFISKKVKRRVQELFRQIGFTQLFIYHLFAVGIFCLLRRYKHRISVTIDMEYYGRDKLITAFIRSLLKNSSKPLHQIYFSRIGNRPKVHYAAKNVFDKKVKPNEVLSFEEILDISKKTDGRLRECLSTLVDAQPRPLVREYHAQSKKSRVKNQ